MNARAIVVRSVFPAALANELSISFLEQIRKSPPARDKISVYGKNYQILEKQDRKFTHVFIYAST